MDELEPTLEDCELHEVYVEFLFDQWPLLASMEEQERARLCTAVTTALEAAESPVMAIKARPDSLQLVVKVDVNVSVDEAAMIITSAAREFASDGRERVWPMEYEAEGMSPSDVVDAVVRLR